MCRPPSSSNIDTFFDELTISLSKEVNKFDNPIVIGDFNIDITKEDCSGVDKLEELYDAFNLTNSIKSEICYTNNHKSTIDLFFANKPLSFQGISTTETKLSDCHKFYVIFFFPVSNQKIYFFEIIKSFVRQSFYLI